MMRRSKLESYETVMEALIEKPLSLEYLAYETGTDCTLLQQNVDFLIKNELVVERFEGKKIFYAITERGIAVLRALNFQKYLGKIRNTIRAIDEAMEAVPDITERNNENRKNAF